MHAEFGRGFGNPLWIFHTCRGEFEKWNFEIHSYSPVDSWYIREVCRVSTWLAIVIVGKRQGLVNMAVCWDISIASASVFYRKVGAWVRGIEAALGQRKGQLLQFVFTGRWSVDWYRKVEISANTWQNGFGCWFRPAPVLGCHRRQTRPRPSLGCGCREEPKSVVWIKWVLV